MFRLLYSHADTVRVNQPRIRLDCNATEQSCVIVVAHVEKEQSWMAKAEY